jgi:hypothetical protein
MALNAALRRDASPSAQCYMDVHTLLALQVKGVRMFGVRNPQGLESTNLHLRAPDK